MKIKDLGDVFNNDKNFTGTHLSEYSIREIYWKKYLLKVEAAHLYLKTLELDQQELTLKYQ